MTWYWTAIIIGAILPFGIVPREILTATRYRGLRIGFAAWSSMLWLTMPLMLPMLILTPVLEGDSPFGNNELGQIFAVPAVIVIAATLSVLTVTAPSLP